jgi:hypothetical protein
MRSGLLAIAYLVGATSSHAQGPGTRADSLALAIAIYEVAVSNGTQTAHADTTPALVCVGGNQPATDPPAEVLEALRARRTLLIRPLSACKTEPLSREGWGRSLVVDTLTGARGISVSATAPTFGAKSAFVFNTHYYQNGLSAGEWQCRGKRRSDGGWAITTCTMLWIS